MPPGPVRVRTPTSSRSSCSRHQQRVLTGAAQQNELQHVLADKLRRACIDLHRVLRAQAGHVQVTGQIVCPGQRCPQPARGLLPVPASTPVPRHRKREPGHVLETTTVVRPLQRRTQIVLLGIQCAKPGGRLGTAQPAVCRTRKGQVGGVVARKHLLRATFCGQLFAGILAQELMQVETAVADAAHKRLIEQAQQKHMSGGQGAAEHSAGLFHPPPTAERAQGGQGRAFLGP